jgi:hypothetical protein
VVSRRCSSSGACQAPPAGLTARAGAAGFALVAWVLAPRRWAGPRRKGTSSGQGPVAQARHAGVGYSHRDASLDGPPAMAGRPVRPCFPCPDGSGDAVEPAPPAAAGGARDRRRSPAHDVLRAARAVQWPRPRTAAGSALLAAGWGARLRRRRPNRSVGGSSISAVRTEQTAYQVSPGRVSARQRCLEPVSGFEPLTVRLQGQSREALCRPVKTEVADERNRVRRKVQFRR